jgi:hypothetical protein
MIALTIQVMIEPARRTYDAPTRERLAGLFGPPERWAVTTRSLVWSQLDVVVPAFTGSTTIAVPIACNYDMEVAASKYLHSLPDGEAPLAMHFNGVVYYPNDDGTLQMVLIPWSRSVGFRMPVSVWTETIEHYYPNTAWVALRSQTLDLLERRRVDRAHATVVGTTRGSAAGSSEQPGSVGTGLAGRVDVFAPCAPLAGGCCCVDGSVVGQDGSGEAVVSPSCRAYAGFGVRWLPLSG